MNLPCLVQRLRCAVCFSSLKHLASLVAAASCCLLLPAAAQQTVASSTRAQASLPRITLNAGIHLIQAEIANSDAARARGLMFRPALKPSEGMLFVFPRPNIQCFWMRNTFIPLSIAFLNDDGTIVNIADMVPQTDTAHCSLQPVRHALEMRQGWFAERGIRVNSVITGLPHAAE